MSLAAHPDSVTSAADAPVTNSVCRARARRILIDALFLGTLADSLLHQGLGVGLTIWMAVFGVVAVSFARRRGGLTREQIGWLGGVLFFAGCFALRDSDDLLFYDFVALAGALLLFGATLTSSSPMRTILGQRVREVVRAIGFVFARSLGHGAAAIQDSQLGTVRGWRTGRAAQLARGVVLAVPVLALFAVLFASADPLFGALLSLPNIDVGTLLSHLVVVAIFTWLTAGWLHGAFGEEVNRPARRSAAGERVLTLGTTDVTTILGSIVILFALFVSVQVRWLFGGEQLVHATTGLSYAEYARHGFFELVCVSLLVLPVLLATRALIRDEDSGAIRRHRALAIPLLLLVGGVMASALGRMALYVHYFGLSTDRVYASGFMIWLSIVFVWFGLTVLRGRVRDFAAGLTITGFVTLAGLNLANPAAFVARMNIARANEARSVNDSAVTWTSEPRGDSRAKNRSPIDYSYLTRGLGADAVPEVIVALRAAPTAPWDSPDRRSEVRARCNAVRQLLEAWGPHASPKDWRLWHFGAERARRAVLENEKALRSVTCQDAIGERAFGTREGRSPRPDEQHELD